MFLKELFEDHNDDLTKVNWPPKSGEDAYQPGDVYKQRMKKDENKPTSVVPLLQNWVERNNATGEGAQILYALVKHLESSDPGVVEKILDFIKGSEGMDESGTGVFEDFEVGNIGFLQKGGPHGYPLGQDPDYVDRNDMKAKPSRYPPRRPLSPDEIDAKSGPVTQATKAELKAIQQQIDAGVKVGSDPNIKITGDPNPKTSSLASRIAKKILAKKLRIRIPGL